MDQLKDQEQFDFSESRDEKDEDFALIRAFINGNDATFRMLVIKHKEKTYKRESPQLQRPDSS